MLRTTIPSQLPLIQPHFQGFFRHTTFAACKNMDVSLCISFFITVRNFSNMAQFLLKHMVVARTEPPSPSIYHFRRSPSNSVAIGTPEIHRVQNIVNGNKSLGLQRYRRVRPLKSSCWEGRENGETRRSARQRHGAPFTQLASSSLY